VIPYADEQAPTVLAAASQAMVEQIFEQLVE
jgi:hypothetical protein